MTYQLFFQKLTGHAPYPYQEKVQGFLASGKSIILRAPTGAGKTWSVVAPFLYSRTVGDPIGDRLLYALPLRALATNLFESTERAAQDTKVRLQIGGEAQDPFFEADIVFTTIDQLLSSYLMMPVALSPRLDNINAGALPGALIVIDEAHLLDPGVAMGTMIEMLHRLRGVSQFVVMTATLSGPAVDWLAKKLGAEVVSLTTDEVAELPSQKGKERTWRWNPAQLSAEAVLQTYHGGRAIVLCNTVSRAQRVFQDLRLAVKSKKIEVLLLHARFLRKDRQRIESMLTGYFGPESSERDVILVTTQVIEAGVDISAEQMHTELAPMNALMQRAGRVARYPHRNRGAVTVYEMSFIFPYGKEMQPIIDQTRAMFVDEIAEEIWIEQVHAEYELKAVRAYDNLADRRNQVNKAMDIGDRGDLSSLVRDISSVNVLVTNSPDSIELTRGKWPETLNVPVTSLGQLANFFQMPPASQWVAKKPVDISDASGESGPAQYEWRPVESFTEMRAQWFLALNPEITYYDRSVGLVLGEPGAELPIEYVQKPPRPRYQYTREAWVDHARRVTKQAKRMAPQYGLAAKRIHEFGDLEWLVSIACALHDTGKLSVVWQQTAWDWQRTKDLSGSPRIALAHTTWQPGDRMVIFPHHAVEGALMVAQSLLIELQKELGEDRGSLAALTVVSSIARHHAPRACSVQSFRFDPRFISDLRSVVEFPLIPIPSAEGSILSEFPEELLKFNNYDHCSAWALYVVLVRRLRLADQAATSAATDEIYSQ